MENVDIKMLQELVKLKKEKPEEYKELIDGIKDIMKDLAKMGEQVADELQKEGEPESA